MSQKEQKEALPTIPIQLNDTDKALLERYIGTISQRNREYYVRSTYEGEPRQCEIWYLGMFSLGKKKEEAVRGLVKNYLITKEEATAAWLFSNAFPDTIKELIRRHNDLPEENRIQKDNPSEVLRLTQ
jgi:hypothetical protein